MLKVEIKITREYGEQSRQEKKEVIDCFERLSKSYFPFLIISANKRVGMGASCGWNGTLQEFIELVELRETFGKEPDMDKMVAAFISFKEKLNGAT